MIYADNAATTKMSAAAIEAMVKCMEEQYGNPSSLYAVGQRAKETLERARAEKAEAAGKTEEWNEVFRDLNPSGITYEPTEVKEEDDTEAEEKLG